MAIEDLSSLGSLAERIERWSAAGVNAVQVRDKSATDRELYESCVAARSTLPPEIAVLVNRRPDIAVAAGAQGVHLPANGLPTARVRAAFGDRLVIGRSTHSLDEVREAEEAGADYVLFGPVYSTPEKRRYGPPQGLEQLGRAARGSIPVLAVGGIDAGRIPEVACAGASGAAGIRLFRDPAKLAELEARADQIRGVFAATEAAHA